MVGFNVWVNPGVSGGACCGSRRVAVASCRAPLRPDDVSGEERQSNDAMTTVSRIEAS